VTPGGPAEYDAAAPLDGSKVAYRTVRGGRQELWQRSASGDGERLLASGSGATRTSPRWSRDGTKLASMRRNVGTSAAPVANAIAIISAGGGAEQLFNLPPETVVVPDDWSSDGSWILAACKQSSRQPMGTCLIPSSMRGVRDLRVVAADPARSLMCQRFSPDERWISFMAVDSGQRDVSTIYDRWRIVDGRGAIDCGLLGEECGLGTPSSSRLVVHMLQRSVIPCHWQCQWRATGLSASSNSSSLIMPMPDA
jgi:Tol biopolymer transport system component